MMAVHIPRYFDPLLVLKSVSNQGFEAFFMVFCSEFSLAILFSENSTKCVEHSIVRDSDLNTLRNMISKPLSLQAARLRLADS